MRKGPTGVLEPTGTEVRTLVGGARRYRKPLNKFRWYDVQSIFADSFEQWNRHNAPRLGAALAFYTLLSLAPLMLVIFSIVSLVVGQSAAQRDLVQEVRHFVGNGQANAIELLLQSDRNSTQGIVATLVGLVVLLFGASGFFVELRDALNTIWDVPTPEEGKLQRIWSLVKERLFSFALVLAIGFLLLVSLAINAWFSILGRVSSSAFHGGEAIWHVFNFVVSMAVAAVLFAAIYKVIPDVRLRWREAFVGGVVTSVLFTAGKLLVGLYLGKASIASSYGAASSIVLLIVWVYYSSQVFFFGAEFTKVFTDRYGLLFKVRQGIVPPAASSSPATSERQSRSLISRAPTQ